LDQYPELASLAIVPLGISDHSNEPEMRAHTQVEAAEVVDLVEDWQRIYQRHLGHRLVFAADEYYLLAKKPFPTPEVYEGFPMHEDGIGMARTFESEFHGDTDVVTGTQSGFFSWVDGAPAEGYRAPRLKQSDCGDQASSFTSVSIRPRITAPVGILTSEYGAQILAPLVATLERDDVRIIAVPNRFFGGNIAVTGLLVGEDIGRVLAEQPSGHRYLLPDVCLSSGIFLDGSRPEDLPHPVEITPADGISLRRALEPSTLLRQEVSA
jgi:NifB/MoaA-like Fe-S oxidoreductase